MAVLLTSGYNFEGYKIKKYMGFCSGECVLGTGFFSALNAGVADFLGSNSSMYEEKLSKAKLAAIKELQNHASALGANAIIGLDVDYTTFTSDIMGVIANGTAVMVEELPKSSGEVYRVLPGIFREDSLVHFPVVNYYGELTIRPFELLFNMNTKEIEVLLYHYNYKENELSAVNVDLIANTIFGTSYEYSDISFIDCEYNGCIMKTEKAALDIPANQLKIIQSIYVKINHYISSGRLYSDCGQYQVSNISTEKLLEFRKLYGQGVVTDFQDGGSCWTCICGRRNTDNVDICSCCGRTKNVYSKVGIAELEDISGLLSAVEPLNNCKEIYNYLLDIEKESGAQLPSELMEEMKKLANIERFYGNMKASGIKFLKKFVSENK